MDIHEDPTKITLGFYLKATENVLCSGKYMHVNLVGYFSSFMCRLGL